MIIVTITMKDDFATCSVMQCKAVLDPGFYAVDSEFHVLELGFRISIVNRIPDSLSLRIPKPGIPDFTIKNFLDSGIRFALHGANDLLSKQDYELQNWIKDLHDNGYPVTKGHVDHGVPKSFTSCQQLCEFLECTIFTCACQHAAVNFSQLDVYGFPPNSPALMRQPPPTKKGVVTMEHMMKCLATKHQVSLTIATVYDLTRIYQDEVRFTVVFYVVTLKTPVQSISK